MLKEHLLWFLHSYLPYPEASDIWVFYHMPVPFILDSIHSMPNVQCQVFNAEFIQFFTACPEPRMHTILLIEGLWSCLSTSATIFPIALCHWKIIAVQCHQQWIAFKVYAHFSLQQLLVKLFCEGNEPKFTGDFWENSKVLQGDVFSTSGSLETRCLFVVQTLEMLFLGSRLYIFA